MTTPLKALIQERLRAKLVRRKGDDEPCAALALEKSHELLMEDHHLSGLMTSSGATLPGTGGVSDATAAMASHSLHEASEDHTMRHRSGIRGGGGGGGGPASGAMAGMATSAASSKKKHTALSINTEAAALRPGHPATNSMACATITPNESAVAMLQLMEMNTSESLHAVRRDREYSEPSYQRLLHEQHHHSHHHQVPSSMDHPYDNSEDSKYSVAMAMEWEAAHGFYRFADHQLSCGGGGGGLTREEEEQMAAMARLLAASHDPSTPLVHDQNRQHQLLAHQFFDRDSTLSRLISYEELLRGGKPRDHDESEDQESGAVFGHAFPTLAAAAAATPSSCASSPGPGTSHHPFDRYDCTLRSSQDRYLPTPPRHGLHRSLSYDSATTPLSALSTPAAMANSNYYYASFSDTSPPPPNAQLYGVDPDRRMFFPASLDLDMIENTHDPTSSLMMAAAAAATTTTTTTTVPALDASISPKTRLAAQAFVEKRQRRGSKMTPRTMATRRWLQAMEAQGPETDDLDVCELPRSSTPGRPPRKKAKVSLVDAAAATAIVALASPVVPSSCLFT